MIIYFLYSGELGKHVKLDVIYFYTVNCTVSVTAGYIPVFYYVCCFWFFFSFFFYFSTWYAHFTSFYFFCSQGYESFVFNKMQIYFSQQAYLCYLKNYFFSSLLCEHSWRRLMLTKIWIGDAPICSNMLGEENDRSVLTKWTFTHMCFSKFLPRLFLPIVHQSFSFLHQSLSAFVCFLLLYYSQVERIIDVFVVI